MRQCPQCGRTNVDNESICQRCGHTFPPEPIRMYLLRNSPIFTVAALFTVLVFYLLTAVKESQTTVVNGTLLINSSTVVNPTQGLINSGNFTYSILIQPGTIFKIVPFMPEIHVGELLIFTLLSCFLILFGIIAILINDLLEISNGSPSISYQFFYFLLLTFIVLLGVYLYSIFTIEFIYIIFFICWVFYIHISVKFMLWLARCSKEVKYRYIGLIVILHFLISLGASLAILLYGGSYIKPLQDSNLTVTLVVGILGSVIIIFFIFIFILFAGLSIGCAMFYQKVKDHINSYPHGICAQIREIPEDFIQNCIEIFLLR